MRNRRPTAPVCRAEYGQLASCQQRERRPYNGTIREHHNQKEKRCNDAREYNARTRLGAPAGRRPRGSQPRFQQAISSRFSSRWKAGSLLASGGLRGRSNTAFPLSSPSATPGIVSYNFLTVKQRSSRLEWMDAGSSAESTRPPSRPEPSSSARFSAPYVFMMSSNNVYYNYLTGNGDCSGWSPAGVNVGAVAISSGVIPITNEPYVVMINGNNDVFYNYQVRTDLGGMVGCGSECRGAFRSRRASSRCRLSPAIYEPYVFMIEYGRNDVFYKLRNENGSWSGLVAGRHRGRRRVDLCHHARITSRLFRCKTEQAAST